MKTTAAATTVTKTLRHTLPGTGGKGQPYHGGEN
jgi:hypothetical protein